MEYQILKKFFILINFLIIFTAKAQNLPFLISEIMYNPEGNDTDREWIEVFNQSNRTFYLKSGRSGWRINDGENHLFKDEVTIYPQEIFVIAQDKNKFLSEYSEFKGKLVSANFSLKNTSGRIQIFDENKNLLAEIGYQNSCGGDNNGYSIVFQNGICQENKTKKGTPGIYPENLKIETSIENQQFFSQTITNTATFTEQKINTSTIQEIQEATDETFLEKQIPSLNLYISEFLPNPQGNDTGQEFVELYNYGDEEIDLNDFILEIGKKKIKLQGIIEPKEYFVITNKDYNFYIRNQGETLSLYYKDQKIFSISYQGKAPEDKSFSKFENNWQFTKPTPGKENFLVLEKKEREVKENFQEEPSPTALINKPTKIEEKNNLIILGTSLILIVMLTFLSIIFIK